jgi:hypothetical protein
MGTQPLVHVGPRANDGKWGAKPHAELGCYDFRLPPDRTAPSHEETRRLLCRIRFLHLFGTAPRKTAPGAARRTVPKDLHARAGISPHRFIGRAYRSCCLAGTDVRNGHDIALTQLARPCLHKEFQMNAKRIFTNEISDVINTANLN